MGPACCGKIWEHRADYAYVLPAIAVMLIVIAYPIYYTIELSFFKTPPGLQLRDKIFIGFDNYTAILTSEVFWQGHLEHSDLDGGIHFHLLCPGVCHRAGAPS